MVAPSKRSWALDGGIWPILRSWALASAETGCETGFLLASRESAIGGLGIRRVPKRARSTENDVAKAARNRCKLTESRSAEFWNRTGYSSRSMIIGLTPAALRAGSQAAASAVPPSNAVTAIRVAGSSGSMP